MFVHILRILYSGTCAQLYPTLREPTDCSPPGSSVHEVFQARILEWVTISSSRGYIWPWDHTCVFCVSCIDRQILYQCTTWEMYHLILPTVWGRSSYYPFTDEENQSTERLNNFLEVAQLISGEIMLETWPCESQTVLLTTLPYCLSKDNSSLCRFQESGHGCRLVCSLWDEKMSWCLFSLCPFKGNS